MNTDDNDPDKAIIEPEQPQAESEIQPQEQAQPEPVVTTQPQPETQPAEPVIPSDIDLEEQIEPRESVQPIEPKKPLNVPAILLSVLVAVLLGVIGWLLYDKFMPTAPEIKTTQNAQDMPETKIEDNVQAEVIQTNDWIALTSKDGKYSLKYPPTWVTATSPELCSPGLTLLGSRSDKVGKCGSDSLGEVLIASYEGDKTAEFKKSYPSTSVTIDGVTGTRYAGAIQDADAESGLGPENGTKEVVYVVYANGRTHQATYYQYPGEKDVSGTFDVLVVKTLTFLK